jgi:hypothetical protein
LASRSTSEGNVRYVRFQAVEPGPRGIRVGVFGLVNTLAKEGRLTDDEELFRRRGNAWYDAGYTNPGDVDPDVYDPAVNPHAVAWFKASATHLIEPVDGYLAILRAHGVECERVESDDPGRVVYEDDDQVVVVPDLVRRARPARRARRRRPWGARS